MESPTLLIDRVRVVLSLSSILTQDMPGGISVGQFFFITGLEVDAGV
jgi:hypothetical protein